jgi:hypothetical protein
LRKFSQRSDRRGVEFPVREQLPPQSLAEATRPVANFVFVGRIVPEQRVHLAIKARRYFPLGFS